MGKPAAKREVSLMRNQGRSSWPLAREWPEQVTGFGPHLVGATVAFQGALQKHHLGRVSLQTDAGLLGEVCLSPV